MNTIGVMSRLFTYDQAVGEIFLKRYFFAFLLLKTSIGIKLVPF